MVNLLMNIEELLYDSIDSLLQHITADSELPAKDQGNVLDDVWFVQNKHGPFNNQPKDLLSDLME